MLPRPLMKTPCGSINMRCQSLNSPSSTFPHADPQKIIAHRDMGAA